MIALDLEIESRDAEPVAVLSALTANMNRGKNSKVYGPDDFNPASRQLFSMEAQQVVGRRAAKVFLTLAKEQKVPGWVPGLIDMDIVRAAAGNAGAS
jgi:hypothetical protein